MKKTISLLLALVLVLYLSSTALAATTETPINESTNGKQGTTEVSYSVTQNYTVTIPADFTLTNSDSSKTVKVEDVRIESGKSLTIKMKTQNFDDTAKYRVKLNNSYIPYTIQVGGSEQSTNDITVGTFASGTVNPGEVTLTFSTTDDNIKSATESGKHTDTLTFTCSVATTQNIGS